jgi:hypothetical protein
LERMRSLERPSPAPWADELAVAEAQQPVVGPEPEVAVAVGVDAQ